MTTFTINVTKKCRGLETTETYEATARDFDLTYECVICDIEQDACETYDEAEDDKSLLRTTWAVEVVDNEDNQVIDNDTFTVYDF